MRSRFFTLAISVFALSCVVAFGQTQTPPPKVGYFRFWDMLPAASGSFEVRKVNASPPEGAMLIGTAYKYSGYGEYPVGKYRLGVFKSGEDRPIKTFDIDLKPETYFTILVAPQSIDMFDDTEDPKANSATLIIRNFFAGTNVSVLSGSKQLVQSLTYGQSYQVTGLPPQRTTITLRTRLPNGSPAESAADIDFKVSKRATALIIPDSYGRFRPRITPDGKNL